MKDCIALVSLGLACSLFGACSVPDRDYTAAVDATADAPVDASPSMLAASPGGDIALGDVVMGLTTAKTTLTVVNNGGMDSGPIALSFDKPDEGFALVDDACTGRSLAPEHTCTFAIDLTPAHVGATAVALQIEATPGGSLTRNVTGNAITQGLIDIVESNHDFAALAIDATGITKTFNVRNIGQAPTGVPMASTAAGDASYTVDATTCNAVLAQGAMCTVTVRFDPSTVGQKAGSLTVSATPGGQDVATLAGTGTAHVGVAVQGSGGGTVTSTQTGIDCGTTCDADFAASPVTLNAQAKTGSTFAGWGVDCTGVGTCTLNLTGTKSVTATFTLNNYPLTVARNGNGSGTIGYSVTGPSCGANCTSYPYQTLVTLTPGAATGSTFAGWSGDCSGTSNCTVTMDQAHNVTATFTLDRFALTVTRDGTGVGNVISDIGAINCGSTCADNYDYNLNVTLTAVPATGSNFVRWNGCGSTNGATCRVAMVAIQNVTATFDLGNYTLTTAKTGNGTVSSTDGNISCGAGCTYDYAYNAQVHLLASPATGYHFVNWTTGPCATSTSATCNFTMPAAPTTATAAFAITQYDVTVAVGGTGQGSVMSIPTGVNCPGTCTLSVNYNTAVTLTASPQNGSSVSWSGCDTASGNNCNVTATAARNVTATFNAGPQTLTVTTNGNATGAVVSSPAGISCPGSCSTTFAFNTPVTLTAAPQGAATFSGWSGDCSGTNPCTVTMNQAHNVTATFSAGDQTLTLTKSGTGSGTFSFQPSPVTSSGTTFTYHFGATVQITAQPDSVSTFGGWTGACAGQGNPCTITMDQARAVDATFTLVTKRLTIAYASPNNGTGGVTPSPLGTPCGTRCWDYTYGTVVTLTAAADPGSTFNGWSACGGLSTCAVTMNANAAVTATFVTNYTLTVTNTGDGTGTVTGSPGGIANAINCASGSAANCSAEYAGVSPATSVTLMASPAPGSVFTGWTGACSGQASCSVSMGSAVSVTATFTKIYNLTATTSGMGSVTPPSGIGTCGANCTQYLSGTNVSLTAQPASGYYFINWSGDCAGQGPTCTLAMAANRSTTANFGAFNPLTVTIQGGGRVSSDDGKIDCGTNCSAAYAPAPVITLTATPFAGSIFAGWSGGGCTGTGTCAVTMDMARSVTAKFAYKVNFWVNGSGTISTPTPGGIACTPAAGAVSCLAFDPGSQITVNYATGTGYSFAGWTGGACAGFSACTPTVNSPLDVTANFSVNTYQLVVNVQNLHGTPANNLVNGNGFSCNGPCTANFTYNSTVTATAVPSATSGRFIQWTAGPCNGSTNPVCTFTMPVNGTSVTAQFDWFASMTVLANNGNVDYPPLAAKGVSTDGRVNCTNTTSLAGTCTAYYSRNEAITMQYSAAISGGWNFCKQLAGDPPRYVESVGSGDCAPTGGVILPGSTQTCSYTFSSPGDYTSGFSVWCHD